ncbi:methyltransferase domain-containing protein [Hahella sp. KA22]|uniref:SAM-dependent methyltransferase n=1 Tax=Hahella sp. KA22 TaxID=1628392 RepID=UPI000FDE913C|nr:cyclopropane-fatty-acyl-phospholipid synthase family protein [Hahella sp. KA22]AZZ89935.1 class I SAM-dependent methyltransferase [Hahella sp. KA22]QAY53304.1 methyltransferase domain-containing protein [Hahella sp. KA22]
MWASAISKPLLLPERFWKQALYRLCSGIQDGELELYGDGDSRVFGSPGRDALRARIDVANPDFYRVALTGGVNGLAEAWMAGSWTSPDLTALVRLLLRNRARLEQLESGLARLPGALSKLWHSFNRNTLQGSRKNIAAHYDLGNDFFSLFLDESMMYSSAVYVTGEESLEQASRAKLERICRKLALTPNDHLLEIGSGWGGMALYAAREYGCKVTTATISFEQHAAVAEQVQQAGLQDRVSVLLQDYRKLEGRYDKLVSIEMVEAVGHQFLDGYFRQVSGLLKDEGLGLIQAITIDDNRYEKALRHVDFIKRYIFPGSFIPCVSVLTQSAASAGLRLFNLEDIGESYALTLQEWRSRFLRNLPQVREQGFDERFIRMWEFYLCYCEGGFRERAISNVQMLFAKPDSRREQWL